MSHIQYSYHIIVKKLFTMRLILTAAFFTYWIILFGSEIAQTILLCYYSFSRQYLDELSEREVANVRREREHYETNTSQTPGPLSKNNTTTIPLIFHRTWRDDNIPEHWSKSYHNCKETYNKKNWTTILWTDATIRSFLTEHYSNFLPVYDSYPYNIQRVDAARYFILYHFGGLYLDLDVSCREKKDIEDLVRVMESIERQSMFPLTNPIGVSNDVMLASKENGFFEYLIQRLRTTNRWFGLPYLTVLFSTGPMFLSLACMNYPNAKHDLLALSPELYSETDARFFRHLPGSTWHSTDAVVVKWLFRNWLVAFMAFFVACVVTVNIIRVDRRANPSKRRESKPHRLSV